MHIQLNLTVSVEQDTLIIQVLSFIKQTFSRLVQLETGSQQTTVIKN